MGFLKNYFAPGPAKAKQDAAAAAAVASAINLSEKPGRFSADVRPKSMYPPELNTPGGTSPWASRPGSAYPHGDFRNNSPEDIRDMKSDVMVNWLYQQQMEMLWTAGGPDEGVMLKKARGFYASCPADMADDTDEFGFFNAIEMLNVRSAMTVNTRVIKLFLHNNDKAFVPLPGGLRLQVLPDMSYLPRCQKHQFSAFIADRGLLVVWDDEPRHLLARAQNIETALMEMIWAEGSEDDEKKDSEININEVDSADGDDVERQDPRKERPIRLIMPIMSGLTIALAIAALGSGWRGVAQEIAIDGNYLRVAFALVFIPQIWLSLFFFQSIWGNLFQLVGPISQMNQNTKFYSGVAPKRMKRDNGPLPHVTIQMPVYKEGLRAVIEPTIVSIKDAISTYEMQGGTANIFINDDGMQLISEDDARERQDFYDEHNIGWVARPGHDPLGKKGEPFVRAGKFKKASNMNYAMWASARVEDKLLSVLRPSTWSQENEADAYKDALVEVVTEDEGRTWADGNIRIGDYILIIDSDTRVPADCFLDAVSEMDLSPETAILQYASGVMNVTDSFFERGITFFTNMVYTQIKFAVASGDVAPFVGHNAVLRWSAIQNIVYDCPIDKCEKWWSEETVSEDFDMALRLQNQGYLVRLGGYTGDGFKEGVSLTVYDELARWEKYAYGCSELVFHPLRFWFTKGPFTPLFRTFITSDMPLVSRLTILSYIGTYYAIGSAWVLTALNYFIIGLYNGHLDKYYMPSFNIYVGKSVPVLDKASTDPPIGLVFVFNILGNISLAVLRYRIEEGSLLGNLWMNLKWLLMMTCFLGGVSLHVSQSLLSHMFGVDMSWGATTKEASAGNFKTELPKLKGFKGTFAACFLMIAAMIVMATVVPPFYQIRLFIAIWPLAAIITCSVLLPIALNPDLLKFRF